MKYKCEVLAYESGVEMSIGTFEVEADEEDAAIVYAQRAAKKRFPNLEDFEVTQTEIIK